MACMVLNADIHLEFVELTFERKIVLWKSNVISGCGQWSTNVHQSMCRFVTRIHVHVHARGIMWCKHLAVRFIFFKLDFAVQTYDGENKRFGSM